MDLDVISDPAVALVVLEPVRARVLASLAEPGSASTVAAALGEPRQKVNYHVRTLEEHGLVRFVEERARRGLTERVVQASARSYVLSPSVLGTNASDPERTDRLSSSYLIAIAARMVREVADLVRGAERVGKPLATLTIDTEIRFASAADRAAFTAELGSQVASLVARYHDQTAAGGRWHRLIVAAHPRPTPEHPRAKEA
jgi:DNA-binding transcriptional ArsR family regulator